MIKWFNQIRNEDFNLVGGKGYNLSKMYNLGVKVPNGFVITSEAYDAYVINHQIQEKIINIVNSEYSGNEKTRLIKDLFIKDLISTELEEQILFEFKRMSSGRVAVRSSSTVEDLPEMSFAGQYSTYLNVGEKDLIETIILCWQSLWNERGIEYRNRNNIKSNFSHAVVVQEMINSKLAGVIFTANPLTGVRNELLVNASYGLGEAIVSGKVNPDQYTIEKASGKIIKKELAVKEILCRNAGNGIEYVPVNAEKKATSSLKQIHIQTIVNESTKVQDYFGAPQDIEFAIDDDDQLYIVQSREITSLFPIGNFIQDNKLRAYLSFNTVMLGMKEPFSPLGFELFSQMIPTIINVMTKRKKPLDNSFVKEAGGRIFPEITYLLSKKFVAKQFAKAFSGNDLPLEGTMNLLIEQHGKQFTNQGIKFKIPWGIFKYGFSVMGDILKATRIPSEELFDNVKAIGDTVIENHKKQAEKLGTIEERLQFLKLTMNKAFKLSQKQGCYCTAFINISKINKILAKMYGDRFNTDPLTQSFPGCITVELGIKLNHLAKYFDAEQIEPTKDHPKVRELLSKFGHRSTIELDIGVKRWSEEPDYIINLIKSYMVGQMYDRNLADIQKKAQKADNLIEKIYQRVKADKGEKRARKIKKMIIDYRIAAGIREYPKFDIVRMLAIARKVMLDIGKSYHAEGLIDQAEDIFYLKIDDIRSKQGLKQIVSDNRAAYQRELLRTTIPRIVLNTGETYYSAQNISSKSKILQGLPLSAGIYEGKVRVVFDPNTSKLQEGEILVTESTNPAWTPLFITAKGLIMEYGGPVSHGGIVAREYGIPAVVGIPSATDLLKDGQMVRVNGETGTVEILD